MKHSLAAKTTYSVNSICYMHTGRKLNILKY